MAGGVPCEWDSDPVRQDDDRGKGRGGSVRGNKSYQWDLKDLQDMYSAKSSSNRTEAKW